LIYILPFDTGTAGTPLCFGRSKSWHSWPLGTTVFNLPGHSLVLWDAL